MSFHDLSVELCTMIIQELACQGNLKSLSSLCQASKSLYLLGDRILYEWHMRHDECSSLVWTIYNDRVDILKKFMEYGVPVNHPIPVSRDERMTPLALAAQRGSIEIVRHLFTLPGVDWNWANRHQETPLHKAIQWDQTETARLLLTHEEVLVNAENIEGWTALVFAATQGNVEVVELLLAMDSVNPDHRSIRGRSPLIIAADWANSAEVVKLLLDTGRVDVNLVAPDIPQTPLIAAVLANQPEIVKLLVAHPDIDVNLSPHGCPTPISRAAEEGRYYMVEVLLAHPDIDPDKPGVGNAPILRAAN
ncbi:ankyrin repeat-containing domain protein [Trichoderma barbatum]